jgi:hypothetical protein
MIFGEYLMRTWKSWKLILPGIMRGCGECIDLNEDLEAN